MADGIQVDVGALEAQLAIVVVLELGFHLHWGVFTQLHSHLERCGRVALPAGWPFNKQPLQGQVEQFDLPAIVTLGKLGAGIEGNTFEATTFFSHGYFLNEARQRGSLSMLPCHGVAGNACIQVLPSASRNRKGQPTMAQNPAPSTFVGGVLPRKCS